MWRFGSKTWIVADLLLLLLLPLCVDGNGSRSDFRDDRRLAEGKTSYELLVRDSQMPRYGTCWRAAIDRLHQDCKRLDDEVQSRLALAFTNCFLARAGLATLPCDEGTEISRCLADVSSNGFTAYTHFFTHTQSMCHFLQAQVWQQETDNTIDRLSQSSHKVVQTLQDTNHLQDSILAAQKKSLEQQQLLLQSSSALTSALDDSKEDVRGMLEEFRSSTSEQRSLIVDVFDRVASLQNFVLGEVSGFYSLVFYPTALLLSYLLTSTSRTAAARFWLFVAFGCSLAVERSVVSFTVTEGLSYLSVDEQSQIMYNTIWWIRKAATMACVSLLAWSAFQFRDYDLINNALLVQIQRQNLELKDRIERFGIGSSAVDDASDTSDDSDSSQDSDSTYAPDGIDDSCLSVAEMGTEKTQRMTPASHQSPYNLRSRSMLHPSLFTRIRKRSASSSSGREM